MISYEKAKPLAGIDLNYEVVGGTTAPTTFNKENTIWVNTDVEIGEHEFSYEHNGVLKDSTKISKATSTIIFHANTTSLTTQSVGRSAFFECLPNTSYEIYKSAGNLWYIATTQEAPANGVAINILNSTVDSSATITVTTGSNANYLVVFVSNASVEPDITLTCLDIIYTRADGSILQNGDIWIQTDSDASISFNAIKRNEIMVYPKKLKQWNGSSWKVLDGTLYKINNPIKVFQSYSPEDPLVLNYSDQKTAVTGGWTLANRGGYAYHQAWRDSDNAWVMRYSGNNWSGAGWMQTQNKINITGYSALRLTGRTQRGYGDADKGNGYVYIALVNNASGSGENATGYCGGDPNNILPTISSMASQTAVKVTQGYYGDATFTLDLNVSDIDGEYYIQIGRYNHSGYDTFSSFFEKLEFIE